MTWESRFGNGRRQGANSARRISFATRKTVSATSKPTKEIETQRRVGRKSKLTLARAHTLRLHSLSRSHRRRRSGLQLAGGSAVSNVAQWNNTRRTFTTISPLSLAG